MKKIRRNILLNPGPATTTDTVKYAQVVPDICPREKEFCRLMDTVGKKLVKVVNGDNRHIAVMFTSSGTGGMEALISSVIPDNKKVLIINNGAYGARMYRIAQAYYSEDNIIHYQIPYGTYPDISAIEKIIRKGGGISHIVLVQRELE